ncbi:YphA family membrane protein [Paenibacillus protaetiae]|uniref:Uncharacterized protein n=1 Tax=Paenibacillus protaetiae TaxID=2509456 RepID=A0A4P6ESR1_9BACL|nr:hypothetical protein [Paenibacillus protaetiae]QAY66180.1 hypothetical protein ET464_06995 [Paenibacillus protaetiae]
MNPGFISLLILIAAGILLSTGWGTVFFPGVSGRAAAAAGVGCGLLQLVYGTFMLGHIHIEYYGGVFALLLLSSAVFRSEKPVTQTGYLMLCAFIVGIIWGSVKQIYYADPVFYWVHPVWDAPLLGGLLASAFVSKLAHQFALLVWSAIWSEITGAALSTLGYTASIGSLAWWDGLLISLAAARTVTAVLGWLKKAVRKLPYLSWKTSGEAGGDADEA